MTTIKVNRRRVRAWVKALRSGKYKQGRGALRTYDPEHTRLVGYCCLGVACDISRRSLNESWDGGTFLGTDCTLPGKVRDWFGFETDDPVLNDANITCTAANDGDDNVGRPPWSFKKIATALEKRYLA